MIKSTKIRTNTLFYYVVSGLNVQKSALFVLFNLTVYVYRIYACCLLVLCPSLLGFWTGISVRLCAFRRRRTLSAAWAMSTRQSVTTPMLWQAINSVCCWHGKPSASSPRLASSATWAPCTQRWATSPTPFSATSSTWALQRYGIASTDIPCLQTLCV